jgi:hypothetical protein
MPTVANSKPPTEYSDLDVVALSVVTFIGGLVLACFLWFRLQLHVVQPDSWLRCYMWALTLGGTGLIAMLPGSRLAHAVSTALGMAIGTSIGEISYLSGPVPNQLGPIPVVAMFFMGLSAPAVGGAVLFWRFVLTGRRQVSRLVCSVLVVGAVAIGEVPARIKDAECRRLVTEMPSMLRRLYDAEVSHSAGRADKTFLCDGRQQDGLKWTPIRNWHPSGMSPHEGYWTIDGFRTGVGLRDFGSYWISLTCSADASHFKVIARPASCEPTRPPFWRFLARPAGLSLPSEFSINETGELMVGERPAS